MYKSMQKGSAVQKTDPWAYCRNEKCENHGVNVSGEKSRDERAGDEQPTRKRSKKNDAVVPAETLETPVAQLGEPEEDAAPTDAETPEEIVTEVAAEAVNPAGKKPPMNGKKSNKSNKKAKAKKDKKKSKKSEDTAVTSGASAETERSADAEKAWVRCQSAVEEKGPFTDNILQLSYAQVLKSDGIEVAQELAKQFNIVVE